VTEVQRLGDSLRQAYEREEPADLVLVDLAVSAGRQKPACFAMHWNTVIAGPAVSRWTGSTLVRKGGWRCFTRPCCDRSTHRKLLDALQPVHNGTASRPGRAAWRRRRRGGACSWWKTRCRFSLVAEAKLERLGYAVAVVGDGHEAVEAVRTGQLCAGPHGREPADARRRRRHEEIRALRDETKASIPSLP